jgi:hypothetical protein
VTSVGGLVLGKIDGSIAALSRSVAVLKYIDYCVEAPPSFWISA